MKPIRGPLGQGALLLLAMAALVRCGPSKSRTVIDTVANTDARAAAGESGRAPPTAGAAGDDARGTTSGIAGSVGGTGGAADGAAPPTAVGGDETGDAAGAVRSDAAPPEASLPGDAGIPPADASHSDGPAPPQPEVGPAPSSLTLGLVSRWRLDEGSGLGTRDDTATGNHGTLRGGTAWIPSGHPGAQYPNPAALRFDGVDDFVELGFTDLPANNQSQSISLWVNYAAVPTQTTGGGQLFVSLTDGMPNGSRLKLGFLRGRIAVWKFGSVELVGAAAPAPGWHHLVYILADGTHQLWIDGARQEAPTVPPQAGVVRNARLGAGFDGAEAFPGDLDDVRIYNRSLTPAEVAALRAGQQ